MPEASILTLRPIGVGGPPDLLPAVLVPEDKIGAGAKAFGGYVNVKPLQSPFPEADNLLLAADAAFHGGYPFHKAPAPEDKPAGAGADRSKSRDQ